jgi:hypothetical protein
MAKDILKEAIADAKAVREVALANAKAALEEAFTPKLQSMLSARLSEDMDEEMMDEEMDETMYNEEDMDETMYNEEDMDETVGMEKEEKEMEEDLDEEIDLEEILSELELEEGEEANEEKVEEAKHDDDVNEGSQDSGPFRGTVAGKPKKIKTKADTYAGDAAKEGKEDDVKKEAKDDMEEEKLDEMGRPIYKADDVQTNHTYKADYVMEDEDFDLDSLLKEIESLEEKEDVDEGDFGEAKDDMDEAVTLEEDLSTAVAALIPLLGVSTVAFQAAGGKEGLMKAIKDAGGNKLKGVANFLGKTGAGAGITGGGRAEEAVEKELEETKAALETVRAELNEVNLLNSKLLYVNRIFKANQLDESQKLRVVETLDKAESAKEAKLIYETIKDTFTVANAKKASFKNKTKSLKEGIGMASKAVGTSTAPKKEVISESSNMVNRFQKLANIKINE